MSEEENFIARWSRRKRAAAERVDEKAADEKSVDQKTTDEKISDARTTRGAAVAPNDAAAPSEAAFDIAKLPPIESITAESDIRAFLAPGVPAELSRAALRRAWAADPKIRDFVGLADYDWDFNAPGAMAGFGPLEMTDELRRQVAQMVGRSLSTEVPDPPAATPSADPVGQVSVEASDLSIESGVTTAATPIEQAPSNVGTSQDIPLRPDVELHNFVQRDEGIPASQYGTKKSDNAQLITKQPHGRALPK